MLDKSTIIPLKNSRDSNVTAVSNITHIWLNHAVIRRHSTCCDGVFAVYICHIACDRITKR